MLTLHCSPGAFSLAPHVALAEAGAAFDAVRVAIADGDHRRPEYLAVNPRGRMQALDVGGTVVTENAAALSATSAAAITVRGRTGRRPRSCSRS